MKTSSLIAGIVLVVSPLLIGYQFFHWKAEKRAARDMAYICAGNSDYLIDPLDMNLSEARTAPVPDPATGKPQLYKGRTVIKLMVPSLTTQESRYACTMYKDPASDHWTVIPRRTLREMQSGAASPLRSGPLTK